MMTRPTPEKGQSGYRVNGPICQLNGLMRPGPFGPQESGGMALKGVSFPDICGLGSPPELVSYPPGSEEENNAATKGKW